MSVAWATLYFEDLQSNDHTSNISPVPCNSNLKCFSFSIKVFVTVKNLSILSKKNGMFKTAFQFI